MNSALCFRNGDKLVRVTVLIPHCMRLSHRLQNCALWIEEDGEGTNATREVALKVRTSPYFFGQKY
jgi:hypothetical protein